MYPNTMLLENAKPETIPDRREQLARLVHALEARADHDQATPPTPVPTGWAASSSSPPLTSLPRGIIHEWFGPADPCDSRSRPEPWAPALCILTHLARQALAQASGGSAEGRSGGVVLWIGRRCRPYPPLLSGPTPRDHALLRRSIFIDPPDDAARLWAIELALRSPAAIAVIADGSRLNMSASRRLQLAAKAAGALALIARPPAELRQLSAAATRWLVRREPSESSGPRWSVELLRCKGGVEREGIGGVGGVGVGAMLESRDRWIVEWSRAQSAVVVPAPLVRRSGQEIRLRSA